MLPLQSIAGSTVGPGLTSLLVGIGVAAVHGITHNLAGERAAFDRAGVNAAGIAVGAAAMTATWVVLTVAGVA